MIIPLTLHSLEHTLSEVFLILVILTGVRWNLRAVLICTSLMAKDVGMLNISLRVFQPFDICLLRVLCLDLYPTFLLDYSFDVNFLEFFVYFEDYSSV